jgi:hypothetical protein
MNVKLKARLISITVDQGSRETNPILIISSEVQYKPFPVQ